MPNPSLGGMGNQMPPTSNVGYPQTNYGHNPYAPGQYPPQYAGYPNSNSQYPMNRGPFGNFFNASSFNSPNIILSLSALLTLCFMHLKIQE